MSACRMLYVSLIASLVALSLLLVALATAQAQGGTIIYVDADSNCSSGCGGSWGSAYPTLQDALAAAQSGDEIWVAAGVYYPDEGAGQTDNSPNAIFILENGVAIYGGFDPSIGVDTWEDRNWTDHLTVLSGDIDQNDIHENGVVTDTENIIGTNAQNVVYNYHINLDATAVLDGFIITAGSSAAQGAGMSNYGGSPTLTNLTFSGNYAGNLGGGLFNSDGSSPTLTNVTFTGNHAGFGGGGITNSTNSNPTLTDVTFSGNSSDRGGGMYSYDNSSPTLTNVTFSGNRAGNEGGGGMYSGNNTGVLTDVVFIGNLSDGPGGGMLNVNESSPTLTNVTFSDNSAARGGGGMLNINESSPTLTDVIFSGNQGGAVDGGGGLFNYSSSNPNLTNVIFIDNSALQGGGMFSWNNSSPTLTNVTFDGNSAVDNGGGMMNLQNSSADVEDSIFVDNSADNGGAIYQDGGSASITGSCIVGNSDTAVWGAVSATGNWWGHRSGPSGSNPGIGDSMSSSVDVADFLDASILDCPTFGDPDLGITKTVDPVTAVPGDPITYTLTFDNTGERFERNVVISDTIPMSVSVSGVVNSTTGGVDISQSSGAPNFAWTVSDLPVGAGGVITLTGTISPSLTAAGHFTNTATITASNDVTATTNSSSAGVTVSIPVCFATPDEGATVFSSADSQAVRDAVAAASAGDTVRIAGVCAGTINEDGTDQVVRMTQPITLAGSYTETNWITPSAMQTTTLDALQSGRVIRATAALTVRDLTIQNAYLTAAGADGYGAGINASQAITLSQVTLYNNATTGTDARGGGAFAWGVATITSTLFFSNTANDRGGGVTIVPGGSITGTTFLSNTASYGGGAFLSNAGTITNTNFIGNRAGESGGGLYSNSGPWITGASFVANTAGDEGGGIYVSGRGSITGTTFISNTASSGGGGLWIEGHFFGPSYVVNSLFTDNRSLTNEGDAMYMLGAGLARRLVLLHNTLANQSSEDGAAIYVNDGTVGITNTIVASHTVAIERIGGAVREDFNLFENVTTPYSGAVTGGGHSITGTAAFADPAGGDYQLTALSDAIDVGTDAGVTDDFFGNVRPQQGGFDIGFHESPFAPARPDLEIHKAVDPETAAPGEPITYTLTFSNAGPGVAHGVVISDSVPEGVTAISDQWSVDSGVSITQSSDGPNFT